MNKFLLIYLIGVGVDIVGLFLLEWLYYYAGRIRYITLREVFEDLGLSLLSWLTTLVVIGLMALEKSCDYISKGNQLIMRGIVDEDDPLTQRFVENCEKNLKQ